VIDDFVRVSDREAFLTARRLARREGLLVGGSSGTAVAAALRYSQRLEPGKTVVALLPDTGRNYLSKIFSDEWMAGRGFIEKTAARSTAEEVLRGKRFAPIVAVQAGRPAREAVALMQQHGISHLPVLDGERLVGGIDETALVRLLRDAADLGTRSVAEVMGRAAPEVDSGTDVAEVCRLLLAGHPLVVVRCQGAPVAVLTRSDLISHWAGPKEISK
jgi:cystathionine beta-synthase